MNPLMYQGYTSQQCTRVQSNRTRRVHKVKVDKVLYAQLEQGQHHRLHAGAQYFRIRLLLQLTSKGLLRVQPKALARLSTTSSTMQLTEQVKQQTRTTKSGSGSLPSASVCFRCDDRKLNDCSSFKDKNNQGCDYLTFLLVGWPRL
jgi:hypothetical protein